VWPHSDTTGPITFEDFSVGSVNTQGGWSSTGAYDQGVVASTRFASFGGQSLRISSAVTSGSFGDQTFSPGLTAPADESTAQRHFDSTFQIGTTQDDVQPDLHMSVSPDNGSGARMSYLRFEDQSDGVHVFFDDTTDAGPTDTVATFNETDIATLNRTSAHTIRFSIDFFTGPANDVVKIYLDGALKATGTTWEDFYRYDPEQVPNQVPSVSELLLPRKGRRRDGHGWQWLPGRQRDARIERHDECLWLLRPRHDDVASSRLHHPTTRSLFRTASPLKVTGRASLRSTRASVTSWVRSWRATVPRQT